MNTVLVVDDKELMRDSVAGTLQRAGFTVATAPGGEQALDQIAQRRPDAVVTDLKMPGITGIELLERIRGIDDELPVVVMTAFGTVETAVQAMKLGAFNYITKPFEGDELVITIKRAIQHAALTRENAVLRAGGAARDMADPDQPPRLSPGPGGRTGADRLIGVSRAMEELRQQVRAVARSQGTVLIMGESGSGKEVVARALHELSPRAGEAMLAVNCAALSETLLESELFGHERGAFTGAERLRKGRFELADRGTLLLDEVSEVGPHVQAKLLRVLQERAFERVGSSLTMGVDVRVVATSNRDLPAEVSIGRFRQDLYFRLNVLPVRVPSLRERAEDVPVLATHFVEQIAQREGRSGVKIDPAALELMAAYHWPGNVRELQNICERAVVLGSAMAGANPARSIVIERSLIEPWLFWPKAHAETAPAHRPMVNGHAHAIVEHKPAITLSPEDRRTLEDIERDAIISALQKFGGHRQKTARALGIGVRTLGLKLKKWKELHIVEASL